LAQQIRRIPGNLSLSSATNLTDGLKFYCIDLGRQTDESWQLSGLRHEFGQVVSHLSQSRKRFSFYE